MKVGAKVQLFNYSMKERRKELNLTQADVADLAGSGVSTEIVGLVERLCDVPGHIALVSEKLARIARALEMDFDLLFPREYLDLLQQKKLPRKKSSYLWAKEVSLVELEGTEYELISASISDEMDQEALVQDIHAALAQLSERERIVIDLRYGITSGNDGLLLEDVGKKLGVTREWVRQVEARALRRLRHPSVRRVLRHHLAP